MEYLTFFPYDQFRISQEKIIRSIEHSARKKKNILLVAPNGTGKTIMALSGLLPVASEKDLKIIYLCRTHSQNTRVIKELLKIYNFYKSQDNNGGSRINGLSIRGRNEMCLNKTLLSLKANPKESMSICSDLRKNRNCAHFLNLLKKRDGVDDPTLISPELFEKPLDAEDLINMCKEKRLCPYFLTKFLLKEMSVIICNYQWIFNPFILENFLMFIDRELEDCILVIDECHNIIDVATDVNSEKLSPYLLNLCLKDLEYYQSPVLMQSFVHILSDHLRKMEKSLKVDEKALDPSNFLDSLIKKLGFSDLTEFQKFINQIHEFSVSIHEEKTANGEISRDYLGSFADFWIKWINSYSLESYFFCYSVSGKQRKRYVSLEIIALDPREIVRPILSRCHSSLCLSGTVNPYVFNNLMGLNQCGKSYKAIKTQSPFKKKNIKAFITEGVDTKKVNRTPLMYKRYIQKIEEVIYSTPANVGIFCASYRVLQGLIDFGIEKTVRKHNKKLFTEEPGLSASENSVILQDYKSLASDPDGGGVLLGVCGGRNSEGEDYPGDYMNSVIIVGIPYHLPTPRVQAKIDYYDEVFNKQGWNFGYLYPAIQRANQASGRPIRKLNDKGSIIFMDSRFKNKYQWIADWLRKEILVVPDIKNAITQLLYPFWYSK
ncbi:MAG: hypothetical protein GF383_08325 [Candidatus Lokiarchaeota archaeon]|nr:hypothetical protein [Candidatus Lokiarchaeota archaeon]MBD3340357.1 hypothetical protein [Candidatus Lokiarchaeota archaeon]